MEFSEIRTYPVQRNANGVLVRLVDGIGYRMYWATEELTEEDYAFSPGAGCFTIGRLVTHLWGLVNWIHTELRGKEAASEKPETFAAQRKDALERLHELRSFLENTNAEDLFNLSIHGQPFWHVINGPLADALTHVGQIASYRRLNGNPVPEHHVFLGYPKA